MLLVLSEAGLTELLPLVGEEESGEGTSLSGLDGTGLHNIEVAPGLVEVGVEVRGEGITGEASVGAEDLGHEGLSGGLVEGEDTGGLAVDERAILKLIAVSALLSVVGDDGSHEDVISVTGEVGGDDTGVLTLMRIFVRHPGLESGAGNSEELIVRDSLVKLLLVAEGSGGGGKGEEFHCFYSH